MLNDDDNILNSTDDDILGKKPQSNRSVSNPLIQEILNSSGNNLAENVIAIQIPRHIDIWHGLTKVLHSYASDGSDAQHIRALIDIIDEMTDGAVTRRVPIYRLERSIVLFNAISGYINSILNTLKTADPFTSNASLPPFVAVLNSYLNIVRFSVEDMLNEYLNKCALSNYIPNDHIVKFQQFDLCDLGLEATVGNGIYPYHHEFGNLDHELAYIQKLVDVIGESLIKIFQLDEKQMPSVSPMMN